ncbi:MAG: hypothetical protein ACK4WK_07745, partial [Anaerolineae bacterium]
MNLYVTNVLPFLFPLFAAYICASEIQWRTVMFLCFDGIPRRTWISVKAAMAGIALVLFIGLYMIVAIMLGGLLFSWREIYLESFPLSPG